MFRVALASVRGNKLRLGMTALAIVLGVAFVAGTFVLTDSIDRAFTRMFDQAYAGTDVVVTGASAVDAGFFGEQPGAGPTLPESVVDEIATVEGVEAVVPGVEGTAQVIGPDGEPIGGMGPPTLAFSWTGPDEPGPLTLEAGHAPHGLSEITIDAATADTTGYQLGDTIPVQLDHGTRSFELVGITGFGDTDSILGATIVTFDVPTAQQLLGRDGQLDIVTVVGADGVSAEELRDRVEAALDSGEVQVVTAQTEQAEQLDTIRQGLSFLTISLQVFAGIALFVAIFLIVNTFSIIVAQRTREFALLRAVGASSRQVRWAVTVEALVVGLLAGGVGLVLGIGLSQLLQAIFDAVGFGFPDGGLVLRPRTIIVSLLIGVGVTAVASLGPARRAASVSPMEAMRSEGVTRAERVGRARTVAGVLSVILGSALIVVGLAGVVSTPAAAAGAGAALAFLGVALLAPYLAGPAADLVGAWPSRRGVAGRLARNNADGNPKRTASTASALMIGVALVSFVSIFAASATASVNALFASSLGADFIVTTTSFGPGGIPSGVANDLAERPEVGAVSPTRNVFVEIDDEVQTLVGVNAEQIEELVSLQVQGDMAGLAGGLLVHRGYADEYGLTVGESLEVTFPEGAQELPVAGIFENRDLIGTDFVTDVATFDQLGVSGTDTFVFADAAPGVDVAAARAAVEAVADDYATLQVQDQTELTQTLRSQVDQMLNIMIGLLGLALFIALIGIVNTLALSVFERTREIGLLRAVGMTRRQVRSMVRWESVIVAVFGALLGVAVGSLFGWALVTASGEAGIEVLEFPATRLVVYVIVAGIAGVLAAVGPARRAARLDVLRAVTTE